MARVREAGVGDVEAIAEVHVASWRAAYRGVFPDEYLDGLSAEDRRAWWSELLTRSDRALLALVVEEDEGPIVGFSLAGRVHPEEPDTAEVWQIYLAGRVGTGAGTRTLHRDNPPTIPTRLP